MLFNKEKLPTQGYLVFGLPVRGGHAIFLPKYKEEENGFLLIDLLTVIQWVNIACICFFKRETTIHKIFLITLAFRSGGDTISDFSLTEGGK